MTLDGLPGGEDGSNALPEAVVLDEARAKEAELLAAGFLFSCNVSIDPADVRTDDELLAAWRKIFGEPNVEGTRGVRRWLLGETDDPTTFSIDPGNVAVYARAQDPLS